MFRIEDSNVNAAGFLSVIEKAYSDNNIDNREYKKLLLDMSAILNEIKNDYGENIGLSREGLFLKIESRSYIRYYEDSKISKERWLKNGDLHRDGDKPAEIGYYCSNGNESHRSWYMYGERHRGGGKPASISYFENPAASIRAEQWVDQNSSKNKPRTIFYNQEGKTIYTKEGVKK